MVKTLSGTSLPLTKMHIHCKTEHRRKSGFTLIEILCVIAIIGILAALATPSFVGLIASSHVSQTVNGFVSDARYARGEAMRRGKSVTICRTSTPSAVSPACSAGDGVTVGGWREGWVVFMDENGNGAFNAGDTVLRVQEASNGVSALFAVEAASSSAVATGNSIMYNGAGRAIGQQGRWFVYASGALSADASYTRTLCMNSVGRVRVLTGEVPC